MCMVGVTLAALTRSMHTGVWSRLFVPAETLALMWVSLRSAHAQRRKLTDDLRLRPPHSRPVGA